MIHSMGILQQQDLEHRQELLEVLNDIIKIFVYDIDFVQHEVEFVYVLNG
jgi:hypothetical protein